MILMTRVYKHCENYINGRPQDNGQITKSINMYLIIMELFWILVIILVLILAWLYFYLNDSDSTNEQKQAFNKHVYEILYNYFSGDQSKRVDNVISDYPVEYGQALDDVTADGKLSLKSIEMLQPVIGAGPGLVKVRKDVLEKLKDAFDLPNFTPAIANDTETLSQALINNNDLFVVTITEGTIRNIHKQLYEALKRMDAKTDMMADMKKRAMQIHLNLLPGNVGGKHVHFGSGVPPPPPPPPPKTPAKILPPPLIPKPVLPVIVKKVAPHAHLSTPKKDTGMISYQVLINMIGDPKISNRLQQINNKIHQVLNDAIRTLHMSVNWKDEVGKVTKHQQKADAALAIIAAKNMQIKDLYKYLIAVPMISSSKSDATMIDTIFRSSDDEFNSEVINRITAVNYTADFEQEIIKVLTPILVDAEEVIKKKTTAEYIAMTPANKQNLYHKIVAEVRTSATRAGAIYNRPDISRIDDSTLRSLTTSYKGLEGIKNTLFSEYQKLYGIPDMKDLDKTFDTDMQSIEDLKYIRSAKSYADEMKFLKTEYFKTAKSKAIVLFNAANDSAAMEKLLFVATSASKPQFNQIIKDYVNPATRKGKFKPDEVFMMHNTTPIYWNEVLSGDYDIPMDGFSINPVVEKEVIREVPVEKEIIKEVIKEVSVEKEGDDNVVFVPSGKQNTPFENRLKQKAKDPSTITKMYDKLKQHRPHLPALKSHQTKEMMVKLNQFLDDEERTSTEEGLMQRYLDYKRSHSSYVHLIDPEEL